MFSLLSKWPLVRQIRERKDGRGVEAMSENTRAMHARTDGASVARRPQLRGIQDHAFDMRVNVEGGRAQKRDQRLIVFASEIDRESRRR